MKRSENGVISDPFHLGPNNLVSDAEELMARYRISGVPITDEAGKLVGILTNRDLRFETELFPPDLRGYDERESDHRAGGHDATSRRSQILAKHRIEKLPLVDEEGHLRGLITIKDIQKAQKYPNSAKDASGRLLCGAAVGVTSRCVRAHRRR